MNKKFYEAPSQEIVELEVLSVLCGSGDETNPFNGNTGETENLD